MARARARSLRRRFVRAVGSLADVPPVGKPSIAPVEAVLADRATAFGFMRRSGVFIRPLVPGISAWLSFQVRNEANGVDVAPTVGVRWDDLHLTVDQIERRRSAVEPTFSRLLGYLMPDRSANVVWSFQLAGESGWESQASNVLEHVERYGRPWLAQYDTCEAVLTGMTEYGLREYNARRLPVGLILLRKRDEARALLDREVDRLGPRGDEAASGYRRFAQTVKAELLAEPSLG
jgi:hypothetical protein